jgi:hypothetical protein
MIFIFTLDRLLELTKTVTALYFLFSMFEQNLALLKMI